MSSAAQVRNSKQWRTTCTVISTLRETVTPRLGPRACTWLWVDDRLPAPYVTVAESLLLDSLNNLLFAERAEWEEITSFLDGAEIAYDKDALKQDFVNSDVNGDGKLSLDEFIEAYKRGSISDIFCIPTRNRQKIPHHADVQQRSLAEYGVGTATVPSSLQNMESAQLQNKLAVEVPKPRVKKGTRPPPM